MVGIVRVLLVAFPLALSLLSACADNDGTSKDCGSSAPAPTFVLTVRAPVGPLPHDLVLVAQYGGGSERFSLADTSTRHEVLFCEVEQEASPGQGGAGGASPSGASTSGDGKPRSRAAEVLVCELWADSAASVTLSGAGFERSFVELTPDVDERCGVLTKPVEAVLVPDVVEDEP